MSFQSLLNKMFEIADIDRLVHFVRKTYSKGLVIYYARGAGAFLGEITIFCWHTPIFVLKKPPFLGGAHQSKMSAN